MLAQKQFPSLTSQTSYNFCYKKLENKMLPENVYNCCVIAPFGFRKLSSGEGGAGAILTREQILLRKIIQKH